MIWPAGAGRGYRAALLFVAGETFTDARDLFHACYDARRDLDGAAAATERMRVYEDLKAVRYDKPRITGGAPKGAGMTATDARLDFEAAAAPRLDRDRRLISACVEIIYGKDGGGLRKLAGWRGALVLALRYTEAAPWAAVADVMDMSARRCQELAAAALDVLDAVGVAAAIEGRGAAEG